MARSHLLPSLFTCIFALSLLSGAGCFFGEDKDSPSEPAGDTTPPEIVDHYPAVGATNVERNVLIWIEFSESMDEESVTDNMTISPSFGYIPSWDGDVLDITPTNLLNASTIYSVTIDEKSEDSNGNQLGADYIFSFMTGTGGDLTPPTILSTVPDSDEPDVPPLQPIEVRFSEPMNLTSVANSIEMDPHTEILSIEWMGTTMRAYHGILPPDSLITVTIGTLAADLAGNNLASPYTWSFRTVLDEVRPQLLNTDPANGETEVATSLNTVVLTFSEPMNPEFEIPASDIDARLEQAMGEMENPWNEELTTLTLDLSSKLLPGCNYWVRFGSGFTDLAGNVIEPDPTDYEFATVGILSYFPVQNNYTWLYSRGQGGGEIRYIDNHSGGTGTFDLVIDEEVSPQSWETNEVRHLADGSTDILYLGRDEYEEGVYQFTMTWNEPVFYIGFPLSGYAGSSWNFERYATHGTDSLYFEGAIEIEEYPVDLLADYDPLNGTFEGCYVHHMYGSLEFYEDGVLSGTESFHEITWLGPSLGPVRIVYDKGPGDSDTLYVYGWEF
jgi:hypothetical protein